MTTPTVLTTVTGDGVALAEFDSVAFAVTLQSEGRTKEEAIAARAESTKAVKSVIETLKKGGLKIVEGTYREIPSDYPNYEHTGRKSRKTGSIAVCAISFRTLDVKNAGKIFAALSEATEDQVSMDFKIDEIEELLDIARVDAIAKARSRFKEECDDLDLDEDDYTLLSYDIRYDNSQSAGPKTARAMSTLAFESVGSGGGAPEVGVEAGKAVVRVQVRLTMGKEAPVKRPGSVRKTGKSTTGGAKRNGGISTSRM